VTERGEQTGAARATGGPPGTAARAAALDLLLAVWRDGALLSQVAEAPDGPLAPLAAPERARARRLALAGLRGAAPADTLLKPHLRKVPPLPVRAILRLAVTELADGAAAHGVVDSAVALARRDRRTAHLSGLVNAVLRQVAEDVPAKWSDLPPQRLPGWLRGRLQSAWGGKAVAAMEAVQAALPPLDLTARGDPAALAATVGGDLLATGSVRVPGNTQVTALPGYADGAFWVQDAAAALPARVLAALAGERVLDLCAAPGGKTLQLAATGAAVTALDISVPRLSRLRDNLARTGLAADIVVADALDWSGGPFDAVLLDAPCSATGTIRRHPDLPFVKRSADVKPLVALQAALIDRAVRLLRRGGRLVFCTCSLLPEEGEAQVAAALDRHPALLPDPAALDRPAIDPAWRTGAAGLRLRPDLWAGRGGIDGFFIAALRVAEAGADSAGPAA